MQLTLLLVAACSCLPAPALTVSQVAESVKKIAQVVKTDVVETAAKVHGVLGDVGKIYRAHPLTMGLATAAALGVVLEGDHLAHLKRAAEKISVSEDDEEEPEFLDASEGADVAEFGFGQ